MNQMILRYKSRTGDGGGGSEIAVLWIQALRKSNKGMNECMNEKNS